MELDTVSQPAVEEIERLGGADLVIGILESEHTEEADAAVKMVREAVSGLSKVQRAVVVSNNGAHSPSVTDTEPTGATNPSGVLLQSPRPQRHGYPLAKQVP